MHSPNKARKISTREAARLAKARRADERKAREAAKVASLTKAIDEKNRLAEKERQSARAEMARRIQFGIRVSPETLTQLRIEAVARDCSITDVVCEALLKLLGPPPNNIRPAVRKARLGRRTVAA